ncbi:MAG TPA: SRPBCC family protein [Steroidobacteraceae bacterium]|nr:SRPBCC family protein [Steroidobacteraceae bacterium]
MGSTRQWIALQLALMAAAAAPAAEITLTPDEEQRVAARGVVIRATLDDSERRGTVRAAIRIDAPPDIVFGQMTRCADALQYVPHMRLCRVREQAPDGSWQLVEQEIDFGWYAPRIRYVFRADLVAERSITFRQVSGDFKANEGRWELQPRPDGSSTLLLYRAYIDPPAFMPNWLARSTFKREMPRMLTNLRERCEAEQASRARAGDARR